MQSAKCIFGLTIPQSSAGESRLQPLVEEGHIAGEEGVGSDTFPCADSRINQPDNLWLSNESLKDDHIK